jgi:hypothetical protein
MANFVVFFLLPPGFLAPFFGAEALFSPRSLGISVPMSEISYLCIKKMRYSSRKPLTFLTFPFSANGAARQHTILLFFLLLSPYTPTN